MPAAAEKRVGQIGELPALPEVRQWYPTEEQFKDFYGYIRTIQPEAHKDGISIIVPPPSWKPGFQIDVGKFKFSTRVQKINELFERFVIRVRFLTCLREHHDARGTPLVHIPVLGGEEVDLYRLFRAVRARGGYERVCEAKLWAAVARACHYEGLGHAPPALRACYQKLLLPYEQLPDEVKASMLSEKEARTRERLEREGIPTGSLMSARAAMKPARKGGGAAVVAEPERSNARVDGALADVVLAYEPPVAGAERCELCKSGGDDGKMILCDRCNCGFHCYCLSPPLSAVPAGDWLCVDCMGERFGFGSGGRFTFERYSRAAHAFKRDFFESLLGRRRRGDALQDEAVPPDEVEWQFWNAVANPAHPLETLYGSDLDSLEVGSGFPRAGAHVAPAGAAAGGAGAGTGAGTGAAGKGGKGGGGGGGGGYASHAWNVNQIGADSLLAALGVGISGMVVPWLYVGMLFSAFCWHVEDHLCHSVNYLHLGADKTWYGVPATDASAFEAAMRDAAPELFAHEAGLLYRMVTMVPPAELVERGVRVTHARQRAGTFVVTWPAAYHAGFSHGLNCAESTNFAAEDWLPWGRRAAAEMRATPGARSLCFSHEQLLTRLAQAALDRRPTAAAARCGREGGALRAYTLAWLRAELRAMVDAELAQREAFLAREPAHALASAAPVAAGADASAAQAPAAKKAKREADAAAAAEPEPACAQCGALLALSFVRCRGCRGCVCLEHAAAGASKRGCGCGEAAAGGEAAAAPARELVAVWPAAELAALADRLDALVLPYLRWRARVGGLRGCALPPAAHETGAAEAAGVAPSAPPAPSAVLTLAELDALGAEAAAYDLDDDDVAARALAAARERAAAWARGAAAVLKPAAGGAAARLPSGERASLGSLRALRAEHDAELCARFPELRARLDGLADAIQAWADGADALLERLDGAEADASAARLAAMGAELRAHADGAAHFAVGLEARARLAARARCCDWLAEAGHARADGAAALPFADLRALVERGKRLGLSAAECAPYAALRARVAETGAWLLRAHAALREGAAADALGALLATAEALVVRAPAKELDTVRARRDAVLAWASGTAALLARAAPRATAAELSGARATAARLKLVAHAAAGAVGEAPASTEAALARALATRLAGASEWRRCAQAVFAKSKACRRSLAAIAADDTARMSADEANAACAHCAGEVNDTLAPRAVGWLACDSCGGWVHAHCVALSAAAADALGAYTCARCCARGGRAYALGVPPPLVVTARPPAAAAAALLASAADLDSTPDECEPVARWLADARAWEARAHDALAARNRPGGAWRAPSPPPPFTPAARGALDAAAAVKSAGGRAAGRRASAAAAPPQPPADDAGALDAARACARELEATACAGVLGGLLQSARGLQVRTALEEVAVTLELCVRELEAE